MLKEIAKKCNEASINLKIKKIKTKGLISRGIFIYTNKYLEIPDPHGSFNFPLYQFDISNVVSKDKSKGDLFITGFLCATSELNYELDKNLAILNMLLSTMDLTNSDSKILDFDGLSKLIESSLGEEGYFGFYLDKSKEMIGLSFENKGAVAYINNKIQYKFDFTVSDILHDSEKSFCVLI